MEEDRAIADLGPDVGADLNGEEDATVEKKPKRRFIGRRAADAKAAAKAQENGGAGIEDSGAVQGETRIKKVYVEYCIDRSNSCTSPQTSSCLEQRPRRYPSRQSNQRGHRLTT